MVRAYPSKKRIKNERLKIVLNVVLEKECEFTDDGFFDELQLSLNKNLEVRLVILSIVDSCQYV